jgi:hypothetical protein
MVEAPGVETAPHYHQTLTKRAFQPLQHCTKLLFDSLTKNGPIYRFRTSMSFAPVIICLNDSAISARLDRTKQN